jgi:hypothetical protein
MVLWGMARANPLAGVRPKTFVLLLLMLKSVQTREANLICLKEARGARKNSSQPTDTPENLLQPAKVKSA